MAMRKYSQIADSDLLSLMKQNNSSALNELFDRYFIPLCRFSYKYLWTKELCEEAVSDIFVNLWLKRGIIEISTSVKAYLYKSVRNQSLNYVKKFNRQNIETKSVEELELAGRDNFVMDFENNEEIENILMTLPERRKLVFKMSRIDGLKYSEIAEILSISVNTVQNHITEAVKSILANKK